MVVSRFWAGVHKSKAERVLPSTKMNSGQGISLWHFFFLGDSDLQVLAGKCIEKEYVSLALVADRFLSSRFLRLSGFFDCYQGRIANGGKNIWIGDRTKRQMTKTPADVKPGCF